MAARANPSRALRGAHTEVAPSAAVTVLTAAIRIGGVVFTLPRPNRHHNILWWLHVLGVRSGQGHDQGFVLSDGIFANRIVAARYAAAAGQITALHAPPHLFSEDLWDGGADLPSVADIEALALGANPAIGQSKTPEDH